MSTAAGACEPSASARAMVRSVQGFLALTLILDIVWCAVYGNARAVAALVFTIFNMVVKVVMAWYGHKFLRELGGNYSWSTPVTGGADGGSGVTPRPLVSNAFDPAGGLPAAGTTAVASPGYHDIGTAARTSGGGGGGGGGGEFNAGAYGGAEVPEKVSYSSYQSA